jgi:hypothetical protein
MKKLLALLFLILTTNFLFSQEKKNTIDNKEEITQSIKLFEQFLKNADKNAIKNIISKNADQHLEEKLKRLQKQLPKGNISIEKISKSKKNEYLVVSQIKPFGIPISIVLDKHYLIKSLDISSDEIVEFSDDFKLDASKIVLPFHLVDGYILIDGEVNGKKGKFMFDTGTPFGLLLNNHYLELEKKEVVTSGNFGSGQIWDVYLDSVKETKIGTQVSYEKLLNIPHSDFSYVQEGIVQDFLGFIGYDFIKNYEFVLDYDYQTITLYKIDNKGNTLHPYSLSNAVVAAIQFTTPDQKQIPVVEMKLDNISVMGSFDTGNQGYAKLNDNTIQHLIQQGTLEQGNQGSWYGQDSDINNIYNISKLNYALTPLIPVKNYKLITSPENHFEFGYQFLKNYITIWNFKKAAITLLQK